MELGHFEYAERPFTSNKGHDIHPLSKEGVSQYLSYDSSTHHYLKNKLPPKLIEELYSRDSCKKNSQNINLNNCLNSSICKYQSSFNAQNKKKGKAENFEIQEDKCSKECDPDPAYNCTHQNETETENIYNNKHSNRSFEKFNKSKNANISNTQNGFWGNNYNKNNCGRSNYQEEINSDNFNHENVKNYYDNNNNNKNNNYNEEYEKLNANLTNTQNKDNLVFYNKALHRNCVSSYARPKSNALKQISSGASINTYNANNKKLGNLLSNLAKFNSFNNKSEYKLRKNKRFQDDYASNMEYLKTNQNSFFNINPEEEALQQKKKYDGFESFNLPRTETTLQDKSKPVYHYTQRIARSCIGKKKAKNEQKSFNKANNQFNQSNYSCYNNNNKNKSQSKSNKNSKEKITDKIKEENEKLKNILNKQTNFDFLNKQNLPKISYIAWQPQLVIKKFGYGGENKFLGDKFNPSNSHTGRGNERNRRNYVGGLYLH